MYSVSVEKTCAIEGDRKRAKQRKSSDTQKHTLAHTKIIRVWPAVLNVKTNGTATENLRTGGSNPPQAPLKPEVMSIKYALN